MTRTDFFNEIISHLPLPKVRNGILRLLGARIAPTVHIMRHCIMMDIQKIAIGAHSIIGHHCHLDGRGGLTIGKNVNITSYTKVFTADHDMDDDGFSGRTAPVIINDHAWISAAAIILPGVTIGRGALIGAGAVVTRDVAPAMFAAGVPARERRKRKSNLTYTLSAKPSRFL